MYRRHIQDYTTAQTLQHHWGYPSRVLPCTSDNGTCEYLDAVYWMHDVSMLYSWILWVVIGGILAVVVAARFLKPRRKGALVANMDTEAYLNKAPQPYLYRLDRATRAYLREWLLPAAPVKAFFGPVSRLQIVLAIGLLTYLLIFSLVGIIYKTWITPVKKTNLHNTRTGVGGWGDRIGVLAYALTPLTVALSTRESILSLLTGIPYHHFNFLHRVTGYIIFIQSFLHTLAWTLVEGRFYQPQPKVYRMFINETYIVYGVIAMFFITFLTIFSMRSVIRLTGYEFFRKTHYVVGILYIGMCWGHWTKLACWMIASLGLIGLDRGIRILRLLLIHTGVKHLSRGIGFQSAHATVKTYTDAESTVVRLDFNHNHDPWKAGQHFFLCFPALSIWQSHPMTVASLPGKHPNVPHHTYIIRAMNGETKKLAALTGNSKNGETETPVIITGPYGERVLDKEADNLLAIAGGTGISFTLPLVTKALQDGSHSGLIRMVWVVRRTSDLRWIEPELVNLKAMVTAGEHRGVRFEIDIFVTRDTGPSRSEISVDDGLEAIDDKEMRASIARSLSTVSQETLWAQPGFRVHWLGGHHPRMDEIVASFVDSSSGGRTQVVASGPVDMGNDLRKAVARRCDGTKVLKSDESGDITLYLDNRWT